jgi:hypothetical protein
MIVTIPRRLKIVLVVCVTMLLIDSEPVAAQLFGQRSMGQPLRPRPGPGAGADMTQAGVLQGNERFMRNNRSRIDFVGPSRSSQQGFVGSEQAIGAGRVPSAAESVRDVADASRRINKPVPPLTPNDIYYPNLVVVGSNNPNRPLQPGIVRTSDSGDRLAKRLAAENPNLRVIRDGDRVTLIGTVADAQQATRIRLLLSFEPGIYEIDDRLVVAAGGSGVLNRQPKSAAVR